MSHIVKGIVALNYDDEEVLRKALETIGVVHQNEQATVAAPSGGRIVFKKEGARYPIVLAAHHQDLFRIGFKREANGGFVPYYDKWGDLGDWGGKALNSLHDRYIAFHYEKGLLAEGYKVDVRSLQDGSIEVLAQEAAW